MQTSGSEAKNLSRKVVLENTDGLHARPATRFVEEAQKFRSKIQVRIGDKVVDGKSVIELLTLGVERGTELELVVQGEDAEEALSTLVGLIESGFPEN